MHCSFPSKKERKQVFKKSVKQKSCNIKSLKKDAEVVKIFSNALDIALDDMSMCIDINDLSDKITSSILNSSDKYIPPLERSKENKPWTDEHFLCLIENRNKAKKVEENAP